MIIPSFLSTNGTSALGLFVAGRSPLSPALSLPAWGGFGPWISEQWARFIEWLSQHWAGFVEWLLQPYVLAVVLAWAVTFTIVVTIAMSLGFGPAGVGAGTLAAAFQSAVYGGFTPAGGIFATLTSVGMLGVLVPGATLLALVIATIVALVVWAAGAGR